MYQHILRDHYKNPRNYGTIENASFQAEQLNPSCGDSIGMSGVIENNTLKDIKFFGKGCVISQSTASILTEYAKNKSLNAILAITSEKIQDLIGTKLGPLRLQCALLPLEVLHSGILSFQNKT